MHCLPQGTCPAQSNAPGGANLTKEKTLKKCCNAAMLANLDPVPYCSFHRIWHLVSKEHSCHADVIPSIGQRCFWMWQNCSTFGPMPEPMRLASIRAAVNHSNAISTMRTNSSSGRSARGHGCCQNWKRHVTGCHDPQILALHMGCIDHGQSHTPSIGHETDTY